MGTQTLVVVFRPPELQIPVSRPRFAKGQPFEFGLGNKLVQELGSFAEGSLNPPTQTSTLKFVDEITTEVMQANKAAELFQTMEIVSLNLEVSNLEKKLATKEKEIAILQLELDKKKVF
jgi:hypothetical protein